MNDVAKITIPQAESLISAHPDLDIKIDSLCEPVMDLNEAKELIEGQFLIVSYIGAFVGAPKPKPRKKP